LTAESTELNLETSQDVAAIYTGKYTLSQYTDKSAKDYALRLLSVRDRSRKELEGRLHRKGFEVGDIQEVLSDLEAAGLIDDRQFSRAYVQAKAHRIWGPRRILFELHKKGVADRIAKQALEEAYDETLVKTKAISKISKLLDQYSDLGRRERERKIYQYFARRGHGSEFIQEILRNSAEES
jgi:regulatory protein